MIRVLARDLCEPYAEVLTEDEMSLVFGGGDCVTAAGISELQGGGTTLDPERIDCA